MWLGLSVLMQVVLSGALCAQTRAPMSRAFRERGLALLWLATASAWLALLWERPQGAPDWALGLVCGLGFGPVLWSPLAALQTPPGEANPQSSTTTGGRRLQDWTLHGKDFLRWWPGGGPDVGEFGPWLAATLKAASLAALAWLVGGTLGYVLRPQLALVLAALTVPGYLVAFAFGSPATSRWRQVRSSRLVTAGFRVAAGVGVLGAPLWMAGQGLGVWVVSPTVYLCLVWVLVWLGGPWRHWGQPANGPGLPTLWGAVFSLSKEGQAAVRSLLGEAAWREFFGGTITCTSQARARALAEVEARLNRPVALWESLSRSEPKHTARLIQQMLEQGGAEAGPGVAIALMSLPPEVSANLFKELGPETVQAITLEITRLPAVTPELRESVLERVLNLHRAQGGDWLSLEEATRVCPSTVGTILRSYLPAPALPAYRCCCGQTHSGRERLRQHRARCETYQARPHVRYRWVPLMVGLAVLTWSTLGALGAQRAQSWWAQQFGPEQVASRQIRGLLDGVGLSVRAVSVRAAGDHLACLVVLEDPAPCGQIEELARSAAQLAGRPVQIQVLVATTPAWEPDRFRWSLLVALLGLGCGWAGVVRWRSRSRLRPIRRQAPNEIVCRRIPPRVDLRESPVRVDEVLPRLNVPLIQVEVGRALLSFVDPNQGQPLGRRVRQLRRNLLQRMGLPLPGVNFCDNLSLQPNAYRIRIRDYVEASGTVQVHQFLAIGPDEKLNCLKGEAATEPVHGLKGIWIGPEQRGDAERLGLLWFDPVALIGYHLHHVVTTEAARLLTAESLERRLSSLAEVYPRLVGNYRLVAAASPSTLRRSLCDLLREGVPIRDLVSVLETYLDNPAARTDAVALTELLRTALAGPICEARAGSDECLRYFTLDSEQLERLQGVTWRGDTVWGLDSAQAADFLAQLQMRSLDFYENGWYPVVVVPNALRRLVFELVRQNLPDLGVLSRRELEHAKATFEVPPGYRLDPN